jgi:hypothetical protein
MNYTWNIKEMKTIDVNGVTDAVIQTYWEKIGTDENGNTGVFTGATPFLPSSVNPESFIPFEDLTPNIVLGWIQAVVTGAYEQHVNEKIQNQIDGRNIKTPALPWNS